MGFFSWWFGEILGLLPGGAARAAGLARARLDVLVAADNLTLTLESGGRRRTLGRVKLGDGGAVPPLGPALDGVDVDTVDVLVELAADRALRREVVIPRVPAPQVRQALAGEVERQTPFRADQVFFFYAENPAGGGPHELAADLAVAPRRFIDPVVDRLVTEGVARERVRAGIAGLGASLPAAEGAPPRPAGLPRAVAVPLAVLLVLAITAVAAPAFRLYLAHEALASKQAETASDAQQVRAMMAEAERLSAGLSIALRARGEWPSAVRVLDTLTRVLPDDTWLDQLNVVGREVEIEGTTRGSAALVRALGAAPGFQNLTYVTPVVREAATNSERFHFAIRYTGP